MSAIERRRIHITETPRLAEIIDRNAIPGEPRATTVARLVERADTLGNQDEDFLVIPPTGRRRVTNEDVAAALDEEDNELIAEALRD